MPYKVPNCSDFLIAFATPAKLELITDVGPPDWPIMQLPFMELKYCGK
jgi:hypothetical protein